jgi:hypothetical protein
MAYDLDFLTKLKKYRVRPLTRQAGPRAESLQTAMVAPLRSIYPRGGKVLCNAHLCILPLLLLRAAPLCKFDRRFDCFMLGTRLHHGSCSHHGRAPTPQHWPLATSCAPSNPSVARIITACACRTVSCQAADCAHSQPELPLRKVLHQAAGRRKLREGALRASSDDRRANNGGRRNMCGPQPCQEPGSALRQPPRRPSSPHLRQHEPQLPHPTSLQRRLARHHAAAQRGQER